MAKQTISQNRIKVLDGDSKKLAKYTKVGCNRHKRWLILLKMDGKTVSDYYAACISAGRTAAAANNVRDAVKRGFIELESPKEEKATKVVKKKAQQTKDKGVYSIPLVQAR